MISFAIPMQRVVFVYLININLQKVTQRIEYVNELFGRSFWISVVGMLTYSAVMGIRKYSHLHPKTN